MLWVLKQNSNLQHDVQHVCWPWCLLSDGGSFRRCPWVCCCSEGHWREDHSMPCQSESAMFVCQLFIRVVHVLVCVGVKGENCAEVAYLWSHYTLAVIFRTQMQSKWLYEVVYWLTGPQDVTPYVTVQGFCCDQYIAGDSDWNVQYLFSHWQNLVQR